MPTYTTVWNDEKAIFEQRHMSPNTVQCKNVTRAACMELHPPLSTAMTLDEIVVQNILATMAAHRHNETAEKLGSWK
uniref:Uncharacterized protein n=1 Tax=Ascaris lumbricoides TaxID=6252 RepID=A0A0M3I0Q4_ASCLU